MDSEMKRVEWIQEETIVIHVLKEAYSEFEDIGYKIVSFSLGLEASYT